MRHRKSREFRELLSRLSREVQVQADTAFERLKADARHPSLHFKHLEAEIWSARVGLHYRALARRDDEGYLWYWIGPHADYDGFFGGAAGGE